MSLLTRVTFVYVMKLASGILKIMTHATEIVPQKAAISEIVPHKGDIKYYIMVLRIERDTSHSPIYI